MKKSVKRITDYKQFDYALIAVLGLLSITWFRGDYLIKAGDSFLTLSPAFSASEWSGYAWTSFGAGAPSVLHNLAHLLYVQMAFFNSLGISLIVQQKLLWYSFFTLGGFGVYGLFTVLISEQYRRLGAIIASVFYMMNTYSMSMIWSRQTGSIFSYALMPIMLALFAKGLSRKKGSINYLVLILIAWLIVPMSLSNPGNWLPVWLVQILYLLFYIISKRHNTEIVVHSIRFTVIFVICWLLVNLWWIVPLSSQVSSLLDRIATSGEPKSIFLWTSQSARLFNSVPLMGDWEIYARYTGDVYYMWASRFTTWPFVILSFLPPVLAFSAQFFRPRWKNVWFFTGMAIVGLFLVKGPQPPCGWLNTLWFEAVPYTGVFRSTYEKLGIIVTLCYAVLIGVSVAAIYEWIRNKKRLFKRASQKTLAMAVISVICLLMFVVLTFPFWTGDVIYGGGEVRPSHRVKIPPYYRDLVRWFSNRPDGKVLVLPSSMFCGGTAYKWSSGYAGSDVIDQSFMKRSIIGFSTGMVASDDFQRNAIVALSEGNTETAAKMLGLMDTRYILVHRDFDTRYAASLPAGHYPKRLEANLKAKEFRFVASNDSLALYELKQHYTVPIIYSTSHSVLVVSGMGNPKKLLEGIEDPFSSTFFILSSLDASELKEVNELTKPEIRFKRLNPTMYKVKIKNALNPFYLIFSESYHPQWKAYFGDVGWSGIWRAIPVGDENHLMANGFANSWYIDQEGDFEMTLFFWPQSLTYIGVIIAGLTYSILLLVVILDWRKNRTRCGKGAAVI